MRKRFIVLMFLIAAGLVQAQDVKLPEIVPPSPTVGSLMKFEEVPIEYYTGQPNISIPIFSKKLNKDIHLNLGLRYATSGVQIDSRSGWVGTGWALETGGVISRTVRGIPDEDKKQGHQRTGVLNNDDFWNYSTLSPSEKDEYNWKTKGSSIDQYDSELDLYQFNLLGVSGRFVVVREGNVLQARLLSKSQNVKIALAYDSAFKINSFTVTDALGYQYFFDVIETSTSTPVNAHIPQSGVGIITAQGNQVVTNISAWHLSEIKTSNDISLVSFTYSDHNFTYQGASSRTENTLLTNLSYEVLEDGYNQSILKPQTFIANYTISIESKKPKKILFNDGTSVNFLASDNHPETFGAVLNSIRIDEKEVQGVAPENHRFIFHYDTTDRLWLDKVSKIGGSKIEHYELSYFEKNNLPAFDSGSDVWGYNSGSISNGVCSLSSFDANAIQRGLLTKITYPTGGSKEFDFEHNTFAYERNQSLQTADYFSLNPLNTDNQTATISYSLQDNNPSAAGGTITLPFAQTVLIKNDLGAHNLVEGVTEVRIKIGNAYTQYTHSDSCASMFLQAGTYSIDIESIHLSVDSFYANGTTSIYYRTTKNSFQEEALAGGVRIKEVRFFNQSLDTGMQTPEKKLTYFYNEVNPNTGQLTNKSSGAIDARYGGKTKMYEHSVSKMIYLYPITNPGQFSSAQISYRVKEQLTNASLTQGSYVGYKNVTVIEDNNGRSTYEYLTARDYPTAIAAFTYPFYPVENVDYKRGHLITQKVYDQDNYILKETINAYDFSAKETIAPSFKVFNLENCGYLQFYDTYAAYQAKSPEEPAFSYINENCGIPSPLYAIKDDLVAHWVKRTESISKSYFYENGVQSVVESRQTFDYNPVNFQQKETNTYLKEGGVEQHYKTATYYPVGTDFLTPYFTSAELDKINEMAGINKINVPVYVETSKNGSITGRIKSSFNDFYTDMYELSMVQTSKEDDDYQDIILYHSYYPNGNIKEVSQRDGTRIVYIWGYHDTVPIAKIENASFDDIPILEHVAAVIASNADTDLVTENHLRTSLANLRNHANLSQSLVTSFTFDPLIGVTSITDARGETLYYHYDAFNRLEYVKDANGKIVSANEYNYKN